MIKPEYYHREDKSNEVHSETVIKVSDPRTITWISVTGHTNGNNPEASFQDKKFSGSSMDFIHRNYANSNEKVYKRVRTEAINIALSTLKTAEPVTSEVKPAFKLKSLENIDIEELRQRLYKIEIQISQCSVPNMIANLQVEREEILNEVFGRATPVL